MTACACGHEADEHRDRAGRCDGQCHDSDYGNFKCLCPYYTEEKI